MSVTKRRISLLSIFITFFVDSLGWSLVFPIFAPLFLDPSNEIFSQTVSVATRTTVLGIFLGAYPLAQFLGAPLLGDVADFIGRKKALLMSIFFTLLGYLFTGWSIHYESLLGLFFGRFLTGIFSGNLAVCMASIADLSPSQKKKISLFSFLSFLGGVSFVVGVFIGGNFSDKGVSSYFSPALPFWIAGGLSLLNLIILSFGFHETFSHTGAPKYDLWESIRNIQKILAHKTLKQVYLIYFLFLFSWTMIFQFTPVLIVRDFGFSNSQVGNTALFIGLCWALGTLLFRKILSKKFTTMHLLEISIFSYTFLCACIPFANKMGLLFPILGLTMVFAGMAWPLFAGWFSGFSPIGSRGKVLGMSLSMQSLAMGLSPLLGGFFSHLSLHGPFLLAGLSSLMAGFLYYLGRKRIPQHYSED
jgi:MFS transporter, DHA1 family, tetracycline resistance protein